MNKKDPFGRRPNTQALGSQTNVHGMGSGAWSARLASGVFLVLLTLLALGFTSLACSGGGSSTPTEPQDPNAPLTRADFVDGLFFGSGRLGRGGCPVPSRWASYERGRRVQVVLGSTITTQARETLRLEVDNLNIALNGYFSISITESPQRIPQPRSFQIVSSDLSDSEIESFCGPGTSGCSQIVFSNGPILNSSRGFQKTSFPGTAHVHEIGHGLGFCHLDFSRVPGAMMGDRQRSDTKTFTSSELDAIAAVYSSGLPPGASRDDFVRAGLIRP